MPCEISVTRDNTYQIILPKECFECFSFEHLMGQQLGLLDAAKDVTSDPLCSQQTQQAMPDARLQQNACK